jgi:hypothetical protein
VVGIRVSDGRGGKVRRPVSMFIGIDFRSDNLFWIHSTCEAFCTSHVVLCRTQYDGVGLPWNGDGFRVGRQLLTTWRHNDNSRNEKGTAFSPTNQTLSRSAHVAKRGRNKA